MTQIEVQKFRENECEFIMPLPFFLCTQKKKLEKMYYTNGRQKFRENV
jgi:hypothetical protein